MSIRRASIVMVITYVVLVAEQASCEEGLSGLYVRWTLENKKLVPDDAAEEFSKMFRPPVPGALPNVDDVTAIIAEIENTETFTSVQVKVPKSFHMRIYQQIASRRIDQRPRFEWPEVCSLKVYGRNGVMTRVSVYSIQAKRGPLLLSVHGIRYIVDNSQTEKDLGLVFRSLLDEARKSVPE